MMIKPSYTKGTWCGLFATIRCLLLVPYFSLLNLSVLSAREIIDCEEATKPSDFLKGHAHFPSENWFGLRRITPIVSKTLVDRDRRLPLSGDAIYIISLEASVMPLQNMSKKQYTVRMGFLAARHVNPVKWDFQNADLSQSNLPMTANGRRFIVFSIPFKVPTGPTGPIVGCSSSSSLCPIGIGISRSRCQKAEKIRSRDQYCWPSWI